ncbi:MAG: mCpol domain-containing protein [Leptolyngbya sp. UWPOB_LEPTO1]|uniref:mCpol domain-containing protein n=1 Tax=Leptolyngbya sp. UWPOB_LEPTO1 TaxID=2815653 RepID=UPI001AC4C7AF|nr:mCpol domain-containing protein [Leptolyngbya sp. UWPOB_LEPTO1]MBN8559447.1 mCpol domain-containing protein [Leptolyngbya sp. UWPOB_LEPTO1]
MSHIYVAADGDDVGRKIEFFIVMNQIDILSNFFNQFQISMLWFAEELSKRFQAEIVFNGGDSLLAKLQASKAEISELEIIRNEFFNISQMTISVGIGESPRQAYFALKLAKAAGKNRIEIFQECVK